MVKFGTLFLENVNEDSKTLFYREEKFKNKKVKISKKEPTKNQENAKRKENLFVVFILLKRQKKKQRKTNRKNINYFWYFNFRNKKQKTK